MMLPEGWETKKLKNVVQFLDGKRRPIKSEERSKIKGVFPYYGATGVIDWINDYIFDEELILMGEDGENILSRNLPHVFIVKGKTWVNNHAHVLRPTKSTDIYYLTAYLESLNYVKYNTGSAQPKLNKATCESIPVTLPPLPEQRKIAAILRAWDEAIEKYELLIEKCEKRKKGVRKELIFNSQNTTKVTLGDVCKIEYGKAVSKNDYNDDGRILIYGTSGIIGYTNLAEQHSGPSIVIGRKGTIDNPIWVEHSIKFRVIDTAYYLKSDQNLRFIYHLLELINLKKWNEASGVPSLNRETFYNIPIKLPPIKEQNYIAQILDKADQEKAIYIKMRTRLFHQKQGLMQKLLTGKWRVKGLQS